MSEGRYFYRQGYGYLLEVSRGWGIGLQLCHFEDHASLNVRPIFGNIFIRLPQCFWREVPFDEMMASWGLLAMGKCELGRYIQLHWGTKSKSIDLPWDYTFIRHDVLLADRTWRRAGKSRLVDGDDACSPWSWTNKLQETHDYTYTLRNGTVQHRKATLGIEEREWRQKWLKWCPWFAKVRRTIEIRFDDEVGERSGSWKGGCIGCSYDLREGRRRWNASGGWSEREFR